MGFFFNHSRGQREVVAADVVMNSEVDELKQQAHSSTAKASKDIAKLNNLLKANGITLNISIATGARHGR